MPKGGRSKKWEEKLPTTKRETPQIGHFLMRSWPNNNDREPDIAQNLKSVYLGNMEPAA